MAVKRLDTEFDDEVEIMYSEELIETIRGARGALGEPEEPDDDIYGLSLISVKLFDVDFTDRVDMDDMYVYEDFVEKLYEKIHELLKEVGNG